MSAPTSAPRDPRAACPEAEDLAAFLAGEGLDADRRAAIIRHVAECADCYEVFLGAGEVVATAAPATTDTTEVAAASPPAGMPRAARATARDRQRPRVPRWRTITITPARAAAIAALLLGTTWVVRWWLAGDGSANRSLSAMASTLAARVITPEPGTPGRVMPPGGAGGDDWIFRPTVVRGEVPGGDPASRPGPSLASLRHAALRIGAGRIDLEVARDPDLDLGSGSAAAAWRQLAEATASAGLLAREAEALHRVADQATGDPARAPGEDLLVAIEPAWRARLDPRWLEAGAVWESARLAATWGRRSFFADRSTRETFERSLDLAGLPADGQAALHEAREAWRRGEAPAPALFERALRSLEAEATRENDGPSVSQAPPP